MKRPTFEQACAAYVYRYTMEYVPHWTTVSYRGRYFAPHYRTDREWYDNTLFPGDFGHFNNGGGCTSLNQTWPLGEWLDKPYKVQS